MHSRLIHSVVLLFTVAWFAVLLPGHQRGQVRMPGSDASSGACPACVARGGAASRDTKSDGRTSTPCPSSARSCAVCQFIGVLNVPPALVILQPFVEAVGPRRTPIPDTPVAAAPATSRYTRGPPSFI